MENEDPETTYRHHALDAAVAHHTAINVSAKDIVETAQTFYNFLANPTETKEQN